MSKFYFLLPVVLMAVVSCQRELSFPSDNTADTVASTNCKLSKILYYDDAGIAYDSAFYSWSGEQLVRITWKNGTVFDSLFYTNGLCTAVKYFDDYGAKLYQVMTYEYNADNNFKGITSYHLPDDARQSVLRKWDFQYSNSKLTRTLDSLWVYNGTTLLNTNADTTDLYYTGDNVARIYSTGDGTPIEIVYEYDNNVAYYEPIFRNIFLADYYFGFGNVGSNYQHLLTLLSSSNNIVRSTAMSGDSEEWTYGLDSAQRITELRINNTPYIKLFYSCQN